MRRSAIVREVRRDLSTGMAHAGILSLIFGLILTITAGVDIVQIRQLTQAAQEFRETGASVVILNAEGRIDGDTCNGLSRVEGIRASGAIRLRDERITATLLPSAPIQIADVTSGFPSVLHAEVESENATGIILAREAAQPLGLTSTGTVVTDDGDVEVAGVYDYPNDGRIGGYGYLALSPTISEEAFDECWVDIFPQSDELKSLLYTTMLPSKNSEEKTPSLGQLNPRLGTSFDGPHLFSTRITRFMPLVALVAGVALGFMAVRLRRLEFASGLHAGVQRSDMRAIVFLEMAAWVMLGLVGAFSVCSVLVASDMYADRSALFFIAGRVFFSGIAGVGVGTALAWWATREAHLFRYFKER